MKMQIGIPMAMLIALSAIPGSAALADGDHRDHRDEKQYDSRHDRSSGLVREVRQSTRRFRDVNVATAEGYGVFLGCVSGHQEGAMGIHFVNGDLVGDGALDASRPEALVYEAKHGRLRLVAVEYVLIAEAWHTNNEAPPVLNGQSFHFTGSPNRYGLPAFYALHVWAWKHNPHGMFVNWNPRVSCEKYSVE